MSLNLYTEIILDLYKNPLNMGIIGKPTHEFLKNNPLCGDEIKIQLVIEDHKVKEVKFQGIGCAISQASSSLLTEKIKNMSIENIKNLNKDDVLEMLHIPISPVRLKCALLSLDALKGALRNVGDENGK